MRQGLGVVLILIGGVWFLQGINVLKGSGMSGQGFWTFMGLVFIVGGIAAIVRRPARAEDDA